MMATAELKRARASAEREYVKERDARVDEVASRVYDRILRAQQRNADRQTQLLASRKPGRGRRLQAGDLAFLLDRGIGKKNVVKGPFVVERLSGGTVHLRTTNKVPDQKVHRFTVHIERVARCTTITDVLEKLLYTNGSAPRPSPEHVAAQHSACC